MKLLLMALTVSLLISCGKKEEEAPGPNLDGFNGCQQRRLLNFRCDLSKCELNFDDITIYASQGFFNIGQTYCICGNQLSNMSACYKPFVH